MNKKYLFIVKDLSVTILNDELHSRYLFSSMDEIKNYLYSISENTYIKLCRSNMIELNEVLLDIYEKFNRNYNKVLEIIMVDFDTYKDALIDTLFTIIELSDISKEIFFIPDDVEYHAHTDYDSEEVLKYRLSLFDNDLNKLAEYESLFSFDIYNQKRVILDIKYLGDRKFLLVKHGLFEKYKDSYSDYYIYGDTYDWKNYVSIHLNYIIM